MSKIDKDMSPIFFDTLAYAKQLIDAGMPEKQAEVQATTLAFIIEDKITTKKDLQNSENKLQITIKELETKLRTEIKELETKLKTEIKELETKLRTEIREIEVSLKKEIKDLEFKMERALRELDLKIKDSENRLILILGGIMLAGISVVATLVKIL